MTAKNNQKIDFQMNQNLSNPLWSTFQILSNGLDGTFSRERLAKGSGLVGNYGRAEVASPGGGGRENRGESAELNYGRAEVVSPGGGGRENGGESAELTPT